MKPRATFKVSPFTNRSGAESWRVSGTKPDGTRVRANFGTQAEALGERQRLELEAANVPVAANLKQTRLTEDQVNEAEWAFACLNDKSLRTAVEFFLQNYKAPTVPMQVSEAYARFLKELRGAGRRPHTIQNLKVRVGHLAACRGDSLVSDILTDQITELIDVNPSRSLQSKANERRALFRFFEYCVSKSWRQDNPVAGTVAPDLREAKSRTPHILAADEARRLMCFAAEYKEGRLAPYVCLALFAGVRPTELARLDWSAIDLKQRQVTISVKNSKTKNERQTELLPNCAEWLSLYAPTRPPIVPANFQKDFDTLKEHIGYGTPDPKDPERQHLREWQQDTLRHTAASFYCAKVKDEGRTATWCGHGVSVLRKHYKQLIQRSSEVRAFWDIRPKPAQGKIIRMKSAAA